MCLFSVFSLSLFFLNMPLSFFLNEIVCVKRYKDLGKSTLLVGQSRRIILIKSGTERNCWITGFYEALFTPVRRTFKIANSVEFAMASLPPKF